MKSSYPVSWCVMQKEVLAVDESLSFGPLPLSQVISDDVVIRFSGDVLVLPDGYIAAVDEDNIRQWLTQFE